MQGRMTTRNFCTRCFRGCRWRSFDQPLMLLPIEARPSSARSACSSVQATACSLFNTYESMNTDALVTGFKLYIPRAAPMITILVRTVRVMQASVHCYHRGSVIDYLTEVLGDILHLLIRPLALAVPEVLALWYGLCPRRSHRPESTQDFLLLQHGLTALDIFSDAGGHVRFFHVMDRVPKVWFAGFGSVYDGKRRSIRRQRHALVNNLTGRKRWLVIERGGVKSDR